MTYWRLLLSQILVLVGSAAWALEGHDSFDPEFRAPTGAVSHDQRVVRMRFAADQAASVRIRQWDAAIRQERWMPLAQASPGSGVWQVSLPIPRYPTILYYFFEVKGPSGTRYYGPRDPKFRSGGRGEFSGVRDDFRSFRLTVYDPAFQVPEWLQGAVIYQIFPDRFRNGNPANDPMSETGPPRPVDAGDCNAGRSKCRDTRPGQYLGGDLEGVIDELGYLKNLGVNAIYLNPIFRAGSYHRYDTQDYREIDPALGGREAYDRLLSRARAMGIRVILDGVFNHTAADSPYFDLSGRWEGEGACETPASPLRGWYYLPHFQNAATRRLPGGGTELVRCKDGLTYEGWAGIYALPKLNARSPGVRELFYSKRESVAPSWIAGGASGFRLDAAGEIDPGWMDQPDNGFWKGMRQALRAVDPEAVLIGEEWGNATPWLLGSDWDSSMNYRFRTAVLNWMFDSCLGKGCEGGLKFVDNDSNDSSVLGSIQPISGSELLDRLGSIQEDTPPEAWLAMMNLVDGHDTSRILWSLKKISADSEGMALRKLAFLALFQFAYPGAPTVYYGDEAGLTAESVWRGATWVDDPYNRLTYPWADQGGAGGDVGMINHYARLARLRREIPALRTGGYSRIQADDAHRTLVFLREARGSQAWVVLNRSEAVQSVTVKSARLGEDGKRYRDVLTGAMATVQAGALPLGKIEGLSGRILIPDQR